MTGSGGRAVPFNRATVAPRQAQYVAESLAGERIAGDGPFTERCVEHLAERLGTTRLLLTPSCTGALEMSAVLARVGPGDEVIVPSFTFVSSANGFLLFGATPVFVDIDPVHFNVTPAAVEAAITERTKAVVVVHYGGVPCDVDAIAALCRPRGIVLSEDCAHSLFASRCGGPLGRVGDTATFSFHETKNVTCGEGGLIVVNREEWWERAQIVREKGTDRSRFLRGQVDKYTWVDLGSSYLLADPLAAMLLAQLEFADEIQDRRRRAASSYADALGGWAASVGAALPVPAVDSVSPHHLYPVLLANGDQRDRFLDHCRQQGVNPVFHYLPLHLSPFGRAAARAEDCPVSIDVSARLARLPLFSDITPSEVDRVVDVVGSFGG